MRWRASVKEYIQLKKIKLHTITGGFGSLLTDSFINGNRPLLTDKADYWRINCFNYWRIMCITDGFKNNSVTGGSVALLAEYLIVILLLTDLHPLVKKRHVRLHYWRICCITGGIFNRYTITDRFTSLSKAKACAFTLLAEYFRQ